MSKKNMESTRELMGTKEVTNYSVRTYRNDELVYFLIQPSNISVLSQESLSARIYGLMTVLKGITEIEMMCLNSRENFEDNKRYLKKRMEEETNPAVRKLLEKDANYLDRMQVQMATARELQVDVNRENYKIDSRNLKWYAAFHNESHHPHVHLVVYSTNPAEGYLTKKGIDTMRSTYAHDIFRQEFMSIYEKRTQQREQLKEQANKSLLFLLQEMQSGICHHEKIAEQMKVLSKRLMNTSGKKVYGYLKADVKAIVNGIVDELAKEEKVAECYKQWLESKSEILHYYKDADAEQLPLSEQKELKSIKNMVIREAVRYGEGYLYTEDEGLEDLETEREEMDADDSEVSEDMAEVPADYYDAEPETEEPDSQEFYAKWTDAYKEAREYLYGTSEMEPDEEAAYEIMKEEAEQGNAYAMADMGKMYAQGIFVEADKAKAQEWYEKSLKAMLIVEGRKENTYLEYRIGKMYQYGLGTEENLPEAAKWFGMASSKEHNIDAEMFCKQKTAVFLVMPEEDNTKYFIISLILQQLYREILVVADENGGKLDNRVVFYWDEVGTIPKIESAEMMFSASRSRKVSIVPMIQSFAQLNKNYGKEGAEIIIDNCQDTIFGGFAPNSESAEVLSKSLGNKTVMSGSISRGKNDPSQSLQMIQRPLMTPDELKSLPKGNFIVSKTGSHPMRTKLKLFLKWGITFEEPYEIEEKSARKVAYADKREIEEEIIRRYMCCVDEEPESTEQGTASRSGGMLQSQMNEAVAKVRQALRTED